MPPKLCCRSGGWGSGYGASRFDNVETFGSSYSTPGWQRAQKSRNRGGFSEGGGRNRAPLTIEGELVAKSTGTTSAFSPGQRVFHQKFGYGHVAAVDGNKLTIDFDKAGQKRVVDTFVDKA